MNAYVHDLILKMNGNEYQLYINTNSCKIERRILRHNKKYWK